MKKNLVRKMKTDKRVSLYNVECSNAKGCGANSVC